MNPINFQAFLIALCALVACGAPEVELEQPMIARASATSRAISYVRQKDAAGAEPSSLNTEKMKLTLNAWRKLRSKPDLRVLLPDEGQHLHTLALLADRGLRAQDVRAGATRPQALTIEANVHVPLDFAQALGDMVDLAVGVKEALTAHEEPDDPTGTALCLIVLVEQVLPSQMQRFANEGPADLHCKLACVEHNLEAVTGWCVWEPDAALSAPIQSVYDMQNYLEFLCKDSVTEEGLCLW